MKSPEGSSEVPGGTPELTRERLENIMNLGIEVAADFGPVLEALRTETGADLVPRPDGYHLTIVGPKEIGPLREISDGDLQELQKISEQIQRGEGVVIKGIGFIDGASDKYNLRDVDKSKKTAYIALSIPALKEFRERIKLQPKDFHITLGFIGADIHMRIRRQEPIKPNSPIMKNILVPIPKKADQRFNKIPIPPISFGALNGQTKE